MEVVKVIEKKWRTAETTRAPALSNRRMYGVWLEVYCISASRMSTASAAVILWKESLSQQLWIMAHKRSVTSEWTGRDGRSLLNTEKITAASILPAKGGFPEKT